MWTAIGAPPLRRREGILLMMICIVGTVVGHSDSDFLKTALKDRKTRRACLHTASTVPCDHGTYVVEKWRLAPKDFARISMTLFLKCVPCSENHESTGTEVLNYLISI